jgi:hypothetical protein
MPYREHNPAQVVGRFHILSTKLNTTDSEHNSPLSSGVGWNAELTSDSRDGVKS